MHSPTRRTFLKQLGLGAGGLAFLSRLPDAWAADVHRLGRSAPEAEGVASAGILAFLDAVAASRHELHSFMLLRRGLVVAEGWWGPYAPDLNHTLYSLSKSFTSTAVGLAVSEGLLRVDDRVASFFPDDLPTTVSGNLASMRVRDLLTMSAGHAKEPTMEMVKRDDWVKAFLEWPVDQPPGTAFLYNSGATYMLSAIVQKLTGQRVHDYLAPRLFEPLGIEGSTWETCPRGVNTGGWGLSVRSEDIAKFAQLYLQKGRWSGRQIIPATWVEEATSFKIQQPLRVKAGHAKEADDWQQGYCYQFWRSTHGAYRGDGAFGQFAVVMPEQEAVVVLTGESQDLQGELDLVWEHLLPAMKSAPLAADLASQAQLRERLATLTLPAPKGRPTSPLAEQITGRSYALEGNAHGLRNVSFVFQEGSCAVTLRDGEREYPVQCGIGKWAPGTTAVPGVPPRLVSGGAPPRGVKHRLAAGGAWKDERTFEMTWRYIETPHHDTVTCAFDGDRVEIRFLSSIAQMGNRKDDRPVLRGSREI